MGVIGMVGRCLLDVSEMSQRYLGDIAQNIETFITCRTEGIIYD